MTVAVVTDSTAYLPVDLATRHGIHVLPLQVAVGGVSHEEGRDVTAEQIATALREFVPVSTSRPAPAAFAQMYAELADAGAEAIVSIHLSAQMSATLSAAELASVNAPVPVTVVDSESIGMAMGFAVLAAADVAAGGGDAEAVAEAARRHTQASTTVFYVDTLEHLRRGGRIGRASAMVGSALAIKPLLTVRDGHIEPLERVRTASKALARLEAHAQSAAAELGQRDDVDGVDLAVHQLDSRDRAESLAERLAREIPEVRRVLMVEVGAVVGAHVGPGTLAVAVVPRLIAHRASIGDDLT